MTKPNDLLQMLQDEYPTKTAEAAAVVAFVEQCAAQLKQMREDADLHREEMAKLLALTPGRISQLESGALRHAPSLKMMARWAHACGETLVVQTTGTLSEQRKRYQRHKQQIERRRLLLMEKLYGEHHPVVTYTNLPETLADIEKLVEKGVPDTLETEAIATELEEIKIKLSQQIEAN